VAHIRDSRPVVVGYTRIAYCDEKVELPGTLIAKKPVDVDIEEYSAISVYRDTIEEPEVLNKSLVE
jgi:hypothetical protein